LRFRSAHLLYAASARPGRRRALGSDRTIAVDRQWPDHPEILGWRTPAAERADEGEFMEESHMSTAVDAVQKVQAANGVVAERPGPPRFPSVAAPFAAVSTAMIAARLIRRQVRAAAKPSVYWSFASGNRHEFRPTIAPRFGNLLIRSGRVRARRRLLKR
jgi:hypothetical protein